MVKSVLMFVVGLSLIANGLLFKGLMYRDNVLKDTIHKYHERTAICLKHVNDIHLYLVALQNQMDEMRKKIDTLESEIE